MKTVVKFEPSKTENCLYNFDYIKKNPGVYEPKGEDEDYYKQLIITLKDDIRFFVEDGTPLEKLCDFAWRDVKFCRSNKKVVIEFSN